MIESYIQIKFLLDAQSLRFYNVKNDTFPPVMAEAVGGLTLSTRVPTLDVGI